MRIATLDLTPELFIEFCKASGERGGLARKFIVIENPLPDDTEVVRIRVAPLSYPNTLQLVLTSESFPNVPEDEPSQLPLVVYKTVYDDLPDRTHATGGAPDGLGLRS